MCFKRHLYERRLCKTIRSDGFGPAAFTEKCTGFDSPWVFCPGESESVSAVDVRENSCHRAKCFPFWL